MKRIVPSKYNVTIYCAVLVSNWLQKGLHQVAQRELI